MLARARASSPVLFEAPGAPLVPRRIPSPRTIARARGKPGFQPAHGPMRHVEFVRMSLVATNRRTARRSARGVSGLLHACPGGVTFSNHRCGDYDRWPARMWHPRLPWPPRPQVPAAYRRRDRTAWASVWRSTSRAPARPPLPAPRLMTLIRRPLQQGRDDEDYSPSSEFCQVASVTAIPSGFYRLEPGGQLPFGSFSLRKPASLDSRPIPAMQGAATYPHAGGST